MFDVYIFLEEVVLGFLFFELLEEFWVWLNIVDGECILLLYYVFIERNVERVDVSFCRRGVLEDVLEWDDVVNFME